MNELRVKTNIFQGRGYFRRFKAFYPNAQIVSIDEKRSRQQELTDFVLWSFHRDQYLMETHNSFCTSTKAIVIVEAFDVTAPNSDICFKLIVSS